MRKRLNRVEVLRGVKEENIEFDQWSLNVQMNHNNTVETRHGLRTFLTPSQGAVTITLPAGKRCTAYSYQIPSYAIFGTVRTFSMTTTACLTLSSSGLLSGIPCLGGTFTPTITVLNTDGLTFRFRVKLVIEDTLPVILLPGET